MELKKAILDEAHISAYAMHPGGTKMYHTIRPFYYWSGMKREIAKYVSRCAICQQVKAERKKPFGLLQPLPIPQWKWENITMDFVYKLPHTQNGYNGIWFGDGWHNCLDLMEFAYNNIYYSSIGMAPFEALYGKSCRTPLCWSEIGERVLVGPEIVDETTQNVQLSPWKGVVRFGKKCKLSPRYIGPYMITERVIEAAYRLELPPELSKVHDVFHVSMFHLTYDEELVTILDWKDKELRNKTVCLVKVLWRNHSVEEATWETKDRMREMHPRLFYDY
ncbi:unnamed protein product [Malus baccata var. baccata]